MSRSPTGLSVLLVAALLAAPAPSWSQTPDSLDTRGLGTTWGSPDAPVQVVEFTDPSCPYCARFHAEARDSLFEHFVDLGRARWTTLPYQSGLYTNSPTATAALVCAAGYGAEAVEALLTGLYATRDSWVRAPRDQAREHVLTLGVSADLPRGEATACVDAPATRETVDAIRTMAAEYGVRGTPTYFVDGFPLMGALPYPFVKRVLDQRLAPGGR